MTVQNHLLQAKIDLLTEHTAQLERALADLERRQFRPKSERFVDAAQQSLPFDPEIPPPPRSPVPASEADEDGATDEPAGEPAARGRKRGPRTRGTPRRRRLQDLDLPARTVSCPLPAGTVCRQCGVGLKVFGQTTSYRLGWVPGHFTVDEIARDKASCPHCPEQGVVVSALPCALPHALCSDELLVRVLIDKFEDHLPLNRQAGRMAREGVELTSNVLSSWVQGGAKLLAPLAHAIRQDVLAGAVVQGDDTGLPVQDGEGAVRKGRLWVFTDQQHAFYAFSPTKEGEHPKQILQGITTKLVLMDGGSEFNEAIRTLGLERAGCWSHCRRYFFESLEYQPKASRLALKTIQDLFLLDRQHQALEPAARLAARQAESRPLVEGFFQWVRSLSTLMRPGSKMASAVTYARNQEACLRLFLAHPELPLHNNLSELMLRRPVVGRKNWLFAGSEGGAQAACTLFTILASCRLQGLEPRQYLLDVLRRLPEHPVNRVRELVPKNWKTSIHNMTFPNEPR